jgi:type II secretory pathway pseudopilin PulG
MKRKKIKNGFTLIETMVAISFFVIIILASGTMFTESQKLYQNGTNQSELIQNARVCLDRISRELRQSNSLVTSFALNATSSEIFFQNGHDSSQTTYINYYASGTDLIRRHVAYEFAAEPGIYTYPDSIDVFGQPPTELILEERIIGEHFNKIEFSAIDELLHIRLDLEYRNSDLSLETKIFIRNL